MKDVMFWRPSHKFTFNCRVNDPKTNLQFFLNMAYTYDISTEAELESLTSYCTIVVFCSMSIFV